MANILKHFDQEDLMLEYFELACIELGIPPALPNVSLLPQRNQKAIIAFYMLSVIIQAKNEGWVPDWNNRREYKYYPWFNTGTSAGLVFAISSYAPSRTTTNVGSRLCFKSRELAIEWGQKLLPLYNDYVLIP